MMFLLLMLFWRHLSSFSSFRNQSGTFTYSSRACSVSILLYIYMVSTVKNLELAHSNSLLSGNLCSILCRSQCMELQLDCWSATRTQIINLPTNQKGYDTFETTAGKLSARRIQIYPDYFCLGIIFKVILNTFQNNA